MKINGRFTGYFYILEGNLLMQADKDLGTQSHAAVFPSQPVVLWMHLVLK